MTLGAPKGALCTLPTKFMYDSAETTASANALRPAPEV